MSKIGISFQGTLKLYRDIAKRLKKHDAIAELVDNAFDADATRVSIDIDKDSIVVADNGVGCCDFDTLMTLNGSNDYGGKKTGRFGQGLKVAAMALGDTLKVVSRTYDRSLKFSLHWPTTDEDVPKKDTVHRGSSGTTIEIGDLRQNNRQNGIDTLRADLCWTYRSAMLGGSKIVMNGEQLIPTALPPMKSKKVSSTVLSDGRSIHVVAGIMEEGDLQHAPGMHVFYSIRNVCRLTPPKGSVRFFALVDISDRPGTNARTGGPGVWGIGRHKTDLDPEHEDEIREFISEQMADVITQSQREPMIIKHLSLLGDQETTAGGHGTNRPVKTKGGKSGKGGVGDDDGPRRVRGGLHVYFDQLSGDTVGEMRDDGVVLNLENPFVGPLAESRERPETESSVTVLAANIIAAERLSKEQSLYAMLASSQQDYLGEILAKYALKRNR